MTKAWRSVRIELERGERLSDLYISASGHIDVHDLLPESQHLADSEVRREYVLDTLRLAIQMIEHDDSVLEDVEVE